MAKTNEMMQATEIKAEIINLTPHSITFVDDEGTELLVVEPSGQLARVSSSTVRTGWIETSAGIRIPTSGTEYGEVQGVPDEEPGKVYIVSSLVASRCQGRYDILIPNESVRDEKGRIIGCHSAGRV